MAVKVFVTAFKYAAMRACVVPSMCPIFQQSVGASRMNNVASDSLVSRQIIVTKWHNGDAG